MITLAKGFGIAAAILLASNNAFASEALDALVAKAQKEGGLRAQVIDTAAPEAGKIAAAFAKRFGLSGVTVAVENESTVFQKARTAIQSGGTPDFDVMVGEDGNIFSFIKAGLLVKVDDWRQILADLNPAVASGKVKPEQVSGDPFTGYGFLTATRDEAMLYNTNLIKPADLPKTHLDLADPKYKGKFSLPPWSTTFTLGILLYPQDTWVQGVDAIGKNAGAVLFPQESLNRILQGDFAFSPMHYLYYVTAKAKNPNIPLGVMPFHDAIFTYRVFYGVPQHSQHPATAALFALWMTSDETRALLQPSLYQENLLTGQTPADDTMRGLMKDSGAKVLSWFSSPEAQSKFEWVTTTDEGKMYNQAIGQGMTQRK